ncbi:hypothetical protein [Mycoplasma parvum]|uniref:Uncharacterized protein n=1 Tax=Mycoplasma parvum str. Indiana TaxID=1403316 RepID=U5NGH2_9MOLU|nr:hypothetical protein [Mycoplasma parvum]AGX89304.1 hypothetical protein PRV_02890 [Mycoplasma parvum str. Indiana]
MLSSFSKVLIATFVSGSIGGITATTVTLLNKTKVNEKQKKLSLTNNLGPEGKKIQKNAANPFTSIAQSFSSQSSIDLENKRENVKFQENTKVKNSETLKEKPHQEEKKKVEQKTKSLKTFKRRERSYEPELKGKEKWKQEITKRDILLESLYKKREGDGSEGFQDVCILYKNGEELDLNENFDITEGKTQAGMFNSCDQQTSWSLDHSEKYNQLGLWIRGKKEVVNKLLFENWNTLKYDGFTSEIENLNINIKGKGWLNNYCKMEEDWNNEWLEITCLKN